MVNPTVKINVKINYLTWIPILKKKKKTYHLKAYR